MNTLTQTTKTKEVLTKGISLLESYLTRIETDQAKHKENTGEWLSLEELKKEVGGAIGELQQVRYGKDEVDSKEDKKIKKENEYFKIESADECVWLTDKRNKGNLPVHITKSQAKELGVMLKDITD